MKIYYYKLPTYYVIYKIIQESITTIHILTLDIHFW